MNVEYIVMCVIYYVSKNFRERHYFEPGAHKNNIRKREQLNKSFQIISLK